MKKGFTKHKNQTFKIPYSKTTMNKFSLNLSSNGTKKIIPRNKNDTINKETVEGSILDTQTFGINQDSLTNSKLTISKNHSLGKLDNKLIVFTSSLKDYFNRKNKTTKFSKSIQNKYVEEYSENVSSSDDDEDEDDDIIPMENNEYNEFTDEDTNKIDYRYYPKIPEIEANKDKNNKYYWLATYDKLMKKSKIVKILNYYSDSLSQKDSEIFIIEDANSDYKEEESKQRLKLMNEKYNFKEKTMIIQGYELYFIKKHGKPFVQQKKGGKLFIKLYLLNLEQINQIFSYINRLEYKKYINNLNSLTQKNSFKIIHNFNKTIYNYSKIFFLGTYMNINIYLFSHTPKTELSSNVNNNMTYSINDLPSSNKIAKIIKALMTNFPDFSKKYFIEYLMKPKNNSNEMNAHDKEILQQKMNEVDLLLMSNNKKNYKNYKKSTIMNTNTNNVIKNVINGISAQTISSNNSQNNLNLILSNNPKTNSIFRNIEKNSPINYNINNELNCSDFLSNINIEIGPNSNESKGKYSNNIMSNEEYKKTRTKQLNQIILNNYCLSRNKTNKSSTKSICNSKKKGIKRPNICKTISLAYPKKCLTRNNSNNNNYNILKSYSNYNPISNKYRTTKSKVRNEGEKDSNYNNKENNANFLNKNINNEINIENKNIICNNNKNVQIDHIFKNPNSRNTFKITRNKSSVYNPYHTNLNSINDVIETVNNNNNNSITKSKKPIKILSTIRKVISQKMNNIYDNSNSNNLYESNSSFKDINNYRYYNDNNNNCRTNNNSQNKQSEYITPLKKKFYYYYK